MSDTILDKIEKKAYNPFYLMSFTVITGLVFSIIAYGVQSVDQPNNTIFWTICGSLTLMYSFFVCLIGLGNVGDWEKYLGRAIISYLLTVSLLGLLAYAFSRIWISDLDGFYHLIFGMITLGFLVFCSIAGFIKKILQTLDAEERRLQEEQRNTK